MDRVFDLRHIATLAQTKNTTRSCEPNRLQLLLRRRVQSDLIQFKCVFLTIIILQISIYLDYKLMIYGILVLSDLL